MATMVDVCISIARLREIGRLTAIRNRDPSRLTRVVRCFQLERTEDEHAERAREPDARVYANTQRGPVAGEIRFVHHTPPIPGSLTLTGSLVVYVLRVQLSRSPPRSRLPLSWNTDSEFRDYIAQARRIMYWAYKLLKLGFAVFALGRRDFDHMIASPARLRSLVVKYIVQSLLVLQARTQRPIPTCLLCNRSPTPSRAREPPPENFIATDLLEVRSRTCTTFEGLSNYFYPINDEVSVLPPIPPRLELRDRPVLCGLHRYIFQYLAYKVISPRWPVPYLQEDMARYGAVGRFMLR